MVSGKRMIRRLSALLLSATLALSACEKSAKEKLSEAYSAIQSKDADRAEAAIKDALAKEPDAEQAPVLMAQVHRLRAQYEKAEQELDGAWKKNSLDGDKLSTQQKRMKQLFTEEYYPELYREWAESIDAVANPQKFEEIVLKGLKHEKDDKYLNTMLVEFYGKYAEKLIEQGKKAQGADTLEKIKPLYTSSKIRNEALTRASALRLEVYREGAQARFDTSIKPKLVEAELFDAENNAAIVLVQMEIDRKLTEEEAKPLALAETSKQIEAMIREVGQLAPEVPLGVVTKVDAYKELETEYKRGSVMLKSSFSVPGLIEYARVAKKRFEKQQAKDAKAPAKGDDKKPADGVEGGAEKPAEKGADKPAEQPAAGDKK